MSLGQPGKCDADPKVAAAFNKFNATMGPWPDTKEGSQDAWETYASAWRVRLTDYFRDQFVNASPPIKALQGTHYSEYQVQAYCQHYYASQGTLTPVPNMHDYLPSADQVQLAPDGHQVQGSNLYFGNWSYTRQINTPYQQSGARATHYSTADFYVRKPEWWMSGAGVSADH